MVAVADGYTEVVKALIKAGANVNTETTTGRVALCMVPRFTEEELEGFPEAQDWDFDPDELEKLLRDAGAKDPKIPCEETDPIKLLLAAAEAEKAAAEAAKAEEAAQGEGEAPTEENEG
jgi:hypothetical protein